MNRSDPQGAPLIGAVLEGAYRITRLISEGGMGAVYEAVQLRLNKRVAVKLMSRELAANGEALARFHREAEITSRLGHPHLVNVIDFGMAESGEPYLVMEYLDGEDLEHRIHGEGRLSLETAVEITKQVASALDAAHAEGIIHRDLKPANVFLVKVRGEADFVKVLDFGISKIKAARTKLTRATAVIGTPEYMSPEQATGLIEEIDHRTDQWALGCIVWEMLSGHAPFIADDMGALFYQLINLDPHPLARRAPGLPPEVEPVLRRALAKRVADRYPSIKDFSRAFEAAATGRQREVTPPPVVVSSVPVPKGTVAYGGQVVPVKPVDAAPQAGITEPLAAIPEEAVNTYRDSDDLPEDDLPTRRFKPDYLIPVAVIVLLVAGLILLWPRKSPPSIVPPAAPVPVRKVPEVVTLPVLPPTPSVSIPDPEPAPIRPAKAKSTKDTTLDDLLKAAATTDKSAGIGKKPSPYTDPFESDHTDKSAGIGKKPSPYVDPFESDHPRTKPVESSPGPKPLKVRPQRQIQIIEEL
jgi:serine/threonine-protein kinase